VNLTGRLGLYMSGGYIVVLTTRKRSCQCVPIDATVVQYELQAIRFTFQMERILPRLVPSRSNSDLRC
jgi:hypothetical protein